MTRSVMGFMAVLVVDLCSVQSQINNWRERCIPALCKWVCLSFVLFWCLM